MFNPTAVFSGFSVDDLTKAKDFYTDVLGFSVEESMGGAKLQLPNGAEAWMYPKGKEHQPASYTMLNIIVMDIDEAVAALTEKGVQFERYGENFQQDEKGIARGLAHDMGPDIAWFKDPAGNILAVLQVK